MKNITLVVFLIIPLIYLTTCTRQYSSNITYIDIGSHTKKQEIINLSIFSNDINYIVLENSKDTPLKYIAGFDILDSVILITDRNNCLLFNRNGGYISKIGSKGRGPDEYTTIQNACIGENGSIFIKDLYDLLVYSKNGKLIKKYHNTFLINNQHYIYTFVPLCDTLLFGHIPNTTGSKEYKAVIVNLVGQAKCCFENYIVFPRKGEILDGFEGKAHFSKFRNILYYNDSFNDTLFMLTEQSELDPAYVFNLGKFKEPVRNRSTFPINRMDYIYLNKVFQSDKYLFIICDMSKHFNGKRITPINYQVPVEFSLWYNTTFSLGIFDKQTKRLIFSKPTSTDNPLFTSGLYNDIDAGPRFLPMKQVNDSTLAMWVDARLLIEHVSSNEFKNTIPKYPEKKKELEELANSLKETDNPVMVLVRLKK